MEERLGRPVPIAHLLACRVVRVRADGGRAALDLHEEAGLDGLVAGDGDALGPRVARALRRQRRGIAGGHVYDIYVATDDMGPRDIAARAPAGRVMPNALGTSFSVYERTDDGSSGSGSGGWREVCMVSYRVSLLGKRGPRRASAVVRAVNAAGEPADLDAAPLAERLRRGDCNVIELQSILPRWSPASGTFVVDFSDRVTVPSVKNLQLVHPHDVDYVALQFGRVGAESFTLDVRFPFSPLMAFGAALASMSHPLGWG